MVGEETKGQSKSLKLIFECNKPVSRLRDRSGTIFQGLYYDFEISTGIYAAMPFCWPQNPGLSVQALQLLSL